MKRIFLTIFFVILSVFIYAEPSSNEEKAINHFNDFRMELEQFSEPKLILEKISNYEQNLYSQKEFQDFSSETKLILENMIFLEKVKNQVKLIENDKTAKKALKEKFSLQIDKTAKTILDLQNSNKIPSKWLFTNQGDLISFSLQFATLTQAIKSGLEVKTYYEQAINQDATMSFALVNLGMWYYYVPSIAGGDKEKTYQYLKKAVDSAKTLSEEYFSKIIYSQILFERENFQEAKKVLQEAKKICPNSIAIQTMEKLNNAGISWIEYSTNPKKYEKILKD